MENCGRRARKTEVAHTRTLFDAKRENRKIYNVRHVECKQTLYVCIAVWLKCMSLKFELKIFNIRGTISKRNVIFLQYQIDFHE